MLNFIYLGGIMADKRKKSFYLPSEFIDEMEKEALRLDRSLSWVVQRAWIESREKIKAYPSMNDNDD
jgi:uncharacterized small protein (TIGR04563 family)